MMKKWLFLSIAALFFSNCSSQMKVKSDPVQADIFVLDSKTGEKKPLGKTPLELPALTVKETAGDSLSSGEYFTLLVEKQGYVSEKLLVPSTHFGTLVTSIDVKLKQGNAPKEERLAKDILDRLFLAQNLAQNREYERAQLELDKILTDSPQFARALSMRASIYYIQKNYQDSLKWYQKALDADPQMQEAIRMTAKIHTLLNDGKTTPHKSPPPQGKP